MLIPVEPVVRKGPRKDGRAEYLPLSEVVSVLGPPEEGDKGLVKDNLGSEYAVQWRFLNQLIFPVVGTLPAEKDTFILYAIRDEETKEWRTYCRWPVLGWLVTAGGELKPLIASKIDTLEDEEWAILYPNGQCEVQFFQIYDSEKIWIDSLKIIAALPSEDDLVG